MTNYQSILPSTALSIDDIEVHERPPFLKKRWYLGIPAFCLGVLGMAAFFVLHSPELYDMSDSTTATNAKLETEESTLPELPDILLVEMAEQWGVWKEQMVGAANNVGINIRTAWDDASLGEGNLLQQWWGKDSEQAGQWWDKISHSSKDWMDEETKKAKEEAAQTGEWIGEKVNETGPLVDHSKNAVKDWAGGAEHKTGQWLGKESEHVNEATKEATGKTKNWVQENTEKTGDWASGAANKTGQWIGKETSQVGDVTKDTTEKTKTWMQEETKKTGDWVSGAKNSTGHWIGEESEATKEWVEKGDGAVGDAAKNTGQWVGDEAKRTEEWFQKEGNSTREEAEKAGEWFEQETSATENWISDEARASANWFRHEENATAKWLKKEENSTKEFFEKESNVTKHWFQQDVEAVRVWWHNVTHRKSVGDESLLYLNNTAAFTLLADGYGWYDLSRDFFTLQQGWDVQENGVYCSLATSAAVLNSLRGMVPLPTDPSHKPWAYATQDGLFNECTDETVVLRNVTFDGVFATPGGLSLDQTDALLKCNLPSDGWSVDSRHVDPALVSMDQMRKELVMSLMSPAARVLVNYNRPAANQVGNGHFSPIGSYSHAKDAFLIMDVAKYKYPPVWIPTSVLYRSLSTVDACGSWNFPHAQINLASSHPELLHPFTPEDLVRSFRKLGCQATYRGYIIVKQSAEVL